MMYAGLTDPSGRFAVYDGADIRHHLFVAPARAELLTESRERGWADEGDHWMRASDLGNVIAWVLPGDSMIVAGAAAPMRRPSHLLAMSSFDQLCWVQWRLTGTFRLESTLR